MLITMSSKQLSKRAAFFFFLQRISFYFFVLFSYLVSKLLVIFCQNTPSWNGRNNSVLPVEKRRAFGFYRNNNSGHNRCELLTLEIHFLESV